MTTDLCWCGSGKKYKKCHLAFDERLQSMYEQGFELPDRASLKSAADIEGIKRSATINIGVLDYVAERIGPGTTTEEVDRWVHDYTVEHGGIPADLNYEATRKACAPPSTTWCATASRPRTTCCAKATS